VKPGALERIQEGLALFSRGEYAASAELVSPEIEWDTSGAVPDGDVCRGRDELIAYWSALGDRWDDFRIEPERWVVGDDVALMLGRLIARGVGSGVPVEGTWDQVWRVRDGIAVRCENYASRDRAWQASGLGPEDAA